MTLRPLATGAAGALIVVALGAALLVPGRSQSQIVAVPSYVPIGVSASGGASTVWFHEPSARSVLACQTVQTGGSLSNIQCVTTRMP